jgi:hypothetical protein
VQVSIHSDKWIAKPDLIGKSKTTSVRTITSEKLTQVSTTSDTYQASTPVVTFDSWLGQTSIARALEFATQYQFKNIIEDIKVLKNNSSTSLSNIQNVNLSAFQGLYQKLKVDGRLSLSGAKQQSNSVLKNSLNTYTTSYYPLIPATQGSFITVWLRNPGSNNKRPLTNSEFTVVDTT